MVPRTLMVHHKLDSRSLEVFLAVCNAGSMTGAANRLGLTQGAISQQISRLEANLQLRLIVRGNGEFRILPAGLSLQHHARRVVEELRMAERAMEQFHGFSFPSLSVRIMDTLGKSLTNIVVETLQGVAEQIQVNASVTYRHREDLSSGKVDIVISAQNFDPAIFDIYPIAVEPIVLLVPKNALDRDHVELDRLGSMLPFVRYAHQRHLGSLTDSYMMQQMLTVARSIEIDQATAVIDAVRRGKGWAITTPLSLLDPGFETNELDVLPLPPPVPTRKINLVTRRNRLSDLPQLLAKNCREHLGRELERIESIIPYATRPVIPVAASAAG